MEETDSTLLYHSGCDACGSSDAKTVYDDGHSFCFSCRQVNLKLSTFLLFTVHAYMPVKTFYNAVDNGKTKAGAS